MIKFIKYFTLVLFLFLTRLGLINAQGCSDAGACSIGSMEDTHQDSMESELPKIKLSYDQSFGLGEKFIFISQTSLTLEHRILKNSSYTVRVPFVFTSGNLGKTSGIGDVLISFIQQIYQKEKTQLGFLAGIKLKTNDANFSFDGNPLPMAYQTSLGTYDIILGGQYLYKSWDFYMAYQHPFGINKNEYLNDPMETDESKIYFESASLKRGDDIAFRLQKTFSLKNQQNLLPGIMAIYRIQKSEIVKNDQGVILDGSDGLTLNLYVTYSKKLKGNGVLFVTGAFPVLDRKYRADGLTRNFVLSLRITQFW